VIGSRHVVQAGRRLRAGARQIVETAAAASIAWFIAADGLGHLQPFFAPAAALIVLGQARGERVVRTVEILLGVAGGVLVADLVVVLLGTRSTGAIVTVVLVVFVATVAVGAGPLLSTQAAISGLYVAVIAPPTDSLVPVRFLDALVGGLVAVVVSQLSRPRDPLAALVHRSLSVLDEVADILIGVGDALRAGDLPAARELLARARGTDEQVEQLRAQVTAAREDLWVDLHRRERLGRVDTVDEATDQIDYLVRNVRVLARCAITALSRSATPHPELGEVVALLARAVRMVAAAAIIDLHTSADSDDSHLLPAEDATLAAVRAAAAVMAADPALPAILVVGQVRAAAIDLLRVGGRDRDVSLQRVEEALGLPPD